MKERKKKENNSNIVDCKLLSNFQIIMKILNFTFLMPSTTIIY